MVIAIQTCTIVKDKFCDAKLRKCSIPNRILDMITGGKIRANLLSKLANRRNSVTRTIPLMRYSSVVQATNPIVKATKKFLICRKPAINVMIIKIEMICRCSRFSLKEKGIFCFVNSKFRINNRIKKKSCLELRISSHWFCQ